MLRLGTPIQFPKRHIPLSRKICKIPCPSLLQIHFSNVVSTCMQNTKSKFSDMLNNLAVKSNVTYDAVN